MLSRIIMDHPFFQGSSMFEHVYDEVPLRRTTTASWGSWLFLVNPGCHREKGSAHGAQPRIACPLALLRSSLKLPGRESVGADRTGKSMEWEPGIHLEEPPDFELWFSEELTSDSRERNFVTGCLVSWYLGLLQRLQQFLGHLASRSMCFSPRKYVDHS